MRAVLVPDSKSDTSALTARVFDWERIAKPRTAPAASIANSANPKAGLVSATDCTLSIGTTYGVNEPPVQTGAADTCPYDTGWAWIVGVKKLREPSLQNRTARKTNAEAASRTRRAPA